MEKLSADAIKTSANLKYYDEFMGWSALRWVGDGKSIDDVKKLLGMDTLSTAAFKLNANFKYYDKFMTMRVEGWLRSIKTTDDVKKLLGLDTLSADVMKLSPNVKYYDQFLGGRVNNIVARANYVSRNAMTYDEYMSNSVKSWVKSGKSVDDVKKELGLDKLSGEALRNHININPNLKYYDEFMEKPVVRWLKTGKNLDDVKKALGIERLSADTIKLSPNLKYYDQFLEERINNLQLYRNIIKLSTRITSHDEIMSNKVKSWVKFCQFMDDVKKELGLDKLSGEALRNHPSLKYYNEFLAYRVEISRNGERP
ncbi:hypothetical protein JM18_009126 [Phytophthora kernoviae]|uniref:RxLR effector protein n=1 Tax=Phytophthora kernoviae TaxID=325452 RepID=A0A921S9C1_9STRA|nr:hypothetical protein JM18_009126 [Phytophthora kernoviae]